METLSEMDEKRIKEYMATYLKLGLKSEDFFAKFGEYLLNIKQDSINGYKKISIYSFKQFLNNKISSGNNVIYNEDKHMLRLQLWNDGIIEEINDEIPSEEEIKRFYQEKLINESGHND